MAYWRPRIAGKWLWLEAGAGIGVALHVIKSISDVKGYEPQVLPYFNLSLSWLLRFGEHWTLRLPITVAGLPTKFGVSPFLS